MLFSSPVFIFAFLPLVLVVYALLNRLHWTTSGKSWLVLTSLFFYAYWDARYLPLIVGSILFNYFVGTRLSRSYTQKANNTQRKQLLIAGLTINLLLLGYFKYTDFFISNLNYITGNQMALKHIALPLAISFFTFTQIVYLMDSYRGETSQYDLLNYSLFVTFFPHLIAGPIVQHSQIMPQFLSRETLKWNNKNILIGLFIFAIGLFKKTIIADTFAIWATQGFDGTDPLNIYSAWTTSLSYTFQLYFDFSGYCDMAIGVSLLFNIWLPINFNSPYKAVSIQDFWHRWHITLSHFLRDNVYIPLGGNRGKEWRTLSNLFITFVVGGLWHGATWMFVIWGALHGTALVVHRIWRKTNLSMPTPLAWLLTFMFVNATWVFFRAKDLQSAKRILFGMVDFGTLSTSTASSLPTHSLAWGGALFDRVPDWIPLAMATQIPLFVALAIALALCSRSNTLQLAEGRLSYAKLSGAALLLTGALYATLTTSNQVFLYFNF